MAERGNPSQERKEDKCEKTRMRNSAGWTVGCGRVTLADHFSSAHLAVVNGELAIADSELAAAEPRTCCSPCMGSATALGVSTQHTGGRRVIRNDVASSVGLIGPAITLRLPLHSDSGEERDSDGDGNNDDDDDSDDDGIHASTAERVLLYLRPRQLDPPCSSSSRPHRRRDRPSPLTPRQRSSAASSGCTPARLATFFQNATCTCTARSRWRARAASLGGRSCAVDGVGGLSWSGLLLSISVSCGEDPLTPGICSHVLDGAPLTVKKVTKEVKAGGGKKRASQGGCGGCVLTSRRLARGQS